MTAHLALVQTPAKPFEARPYQLEAHAATRSAWASDIRGPMLVMATGTGKTATALSLIVADFLTQGLRVVWLAHRKELVTQPQATVARFWPDLAGRVGIVKAEANDVDAQLACASVASLSPERTAAILSHGPIALVVVDEAHHSSSPTHQKAMRALDAPKLLGLTATAHREDGADLGEDWEIVFSYGIVDAIADENAVAEHGTPGLGYLIPPYAYFERLPDMDLSNVSGRRDYDDAELGIELLRAGVVDHTVAMLTKPVKAIRLPDRDDVRWLSARDRQSLVFTATVEQAKLTAEALRAAGRKSRYVHGGTPDSERSRIKWAFGKGGIGDICNAAVFTEGTDFPWVSCVALARPTRSWSLFVQMVGRGLRLYPGQLECLILDLAGATNDHSLIAAPVLIGGSRCPESSDGIHDFVPCDPLSDGARCSHCNRKVACGATLGPHKWGDTHHCEGCGRPQCPESLDRAHHWAPWADHKRRCMDCGLEIPDPLAGMARTRAPDAVEAAWIRVPGVAPETWVVDAGEHGLLFIKRQRPGWMPVWLPKRHRIPKPLSSRPLKRGHVVAYADDIVKRAGKVAERGAPWRKDKPSAGDRVRHFHMEGFWPARDDTAGDVASRMLRQRARERAIKTGICRALEG